MRIWVVALTALLAGPALSEGGPVDSVIDAMTIHCVQKQQHTPEECMTIYDSLKQDLGVSLGRSARAACQREPSPGCLAGQTRAADEILIAMGVNAFGRDKENRQLITACAVQHRESPVAARDCMQEELPELWQTVRGALCKAGRC